MKNIFKYLTILFLITYSCTSQKKLDANLLEYTNSNRVALDKDGNQLSGSHLFKRDTIHIASYLSDCQGIISQKCLLIKKSTNDGWTYFYDIIQGFNYEEGYEYKLLVDEHEVLGAPADASSKRIELVKVLSKIKKENVETNDVPKNTLEGTWKLIRLNKKEVEKYQANLTIDNGVISLFSGCNTASGISLITKKDNQLEVSGILFQTFKACEDNMIEDNYFSLITKIKKYTISSNSLTFYDENNTELMNFIR